MLLCRTPRSRMTSSTSDAVSYPFPTKSRVFFLDFALDCARFSVNMREQLGRGGVMEFGGCSVCSSGSSMARAVVREEPQAVSRDDKEVEDRYRPAVLASLPISTLI
uniref:Uncharacterized protein n=1 Tax=Plectus sambesii TaxID=2011161 RepID=A0A914VTN4_9BILA